MAFQLDENERAKTLKEEKHKAIYLGESKQFCPLEFGGMNKDGRSVRIILRT